VSTAGTDTVGINFGNANDASPEYKGWFTGHFVGEPDDLEHSEAVEIKWGVHGPGDERAEWSSDQATTITILIRGRMRMIFQDREYVLEKEGDYVIWASAIPHKWAVEADSLIITVRWSSPPTISAMEA
jgi:hypothetical protein